MELTARLHPDPHLPPLASATSVAPSVTISGGTIAALTAAVLLHGRGCSVTLVHPDLGGAGESVSTFVPRIHRVRRAHGTAAAKLVAEAQLAAVATISSIVERCSIDCDLQRLPVYLYTEQRAKVAELKSEASSAKPAGIAAEWITDVPLPFATRGAVRYDDQLQLQPLRYLLGMASSLTARPARRDERRVRIEAHAGTGSRHAVAIPGGAPAAVFHDAVANRSIRFSDGILVVSGGEDVDRFASERFGAEPSHRWEVMADVLPSVRSEGAVQHISGSGLLWGTLAGMIVADTITHGSSAFSDVATYLD